MRAVAHLPLVLFVLGACYIQAPTDPPTIQRAEAGCLTDTDGIDYWYLDANVLADQGRTIETVWVDVEDPGDERYLGSVDLDADGATHWEHSVDSSANFIDCSWPFAYGFTFYAEDDLANRATLYLEN